MNQDRSDHVPPPPGIPPGGPIPGMPGMPPGAGSEGVKVKTRQVPISTEGDGHIVDLTSDVNRLLGSVDMKEGNVTVFVPGSTASITTIEFEPGLLEDLPNAMELIAPQGADYGHERRWHDGNGHSHVRASIMGPSVTVPFTGGRLMLGTWQQIVLVDWDNKSRRREIVLQFIGE